MIVPTFKLQLLISFSKNYMYRNSPLSKIEELDLIIKYITWMLKIEKPQVCITNLIFL